MGLHRRPYLIARNNNRRILEVTAHSQAHGTKPRHPGVINSDAAASGAEQGGHRVARLQHDF